MKLSPSQDKAAQLLNDFLKSDQKVFKLHGWAGTGKSSVISYVLDGRNDLWYCAPTAKAAVVLRDKGVASASTLHSLLYQPMEVVDQVTHKPKLMFKENPNSPLAQGGVVVVDEASMVATQVAEDLVRHPIKVIAIGDPGQLPPVMSKGGGSLLTGTPDAMLSEVHRNALDSPVLELATHVRTKGKLPMGNYSRDGSRIVNASKEAGRLDAYDQVIVGRHKTRFQTITHVRNLQGFTDPLPNPGERVVCKKNDLDKGLINGQQYMVTSVIPMDEDTMLLDVVDPEGLHIHTTAWTHGFLGQEGREKLEMMPLKDRTENTEFWYAAAITAHSSQGSEWGSVCVADESKVFRNHARNWLYTALTRARDSVVVVRR